ncbi:MAG: hypothetical protein JNJ77_09340 [Planctomycetia bacterium]|nr:hypothetical protein [Planctomycetia bacterium]
MEIPFYQQYRTAPIAFDLAAFGKVALTGKDRSSFLQNFTTNDVIKPGTGSGCETFLTTAQARIVAWLRVAIREHDLYVNMEPGLAAAVIQHLEKYIIGEEVQLQDKTAQDFLRLITNYPDAKSMVPWQVKDNAWDITGVSMQRCDFPGASSCFIWGDRSLLPLVEKKTAGIPLLTIRDPLWTTLRLETNTPAHGLDFDASNLPQEVNRNESAISFTKGCYIGQETVARIRAYGQVNKQLRRIKIESSDAMSMEGLSLLHDNKAVGTIKTVAYSPQWKHWLAFAMIRKEHLTPGTRLSVQHDSQSVWVEVMEPT